MDHFATLEEAIESARSQLEPDGEAVVCRSPVHGGCDQPPEDCPHCLRIPFGDRTPSKQIAQMVLGGN